MAIYSIPLYRSSPVLLQNAMVSAHGLTHRVAKRWFGFRRYAEGVEQREKWPLDRIREFQEAEISRVMKKAVTAVPFYRDFCASQGIALEDLRSAEDLKRFPIIDKHCLRSQAKQFASDDVQTYKTTKAYTSGTSGTPLTLTRTLESVQREHAFMWRQFRWAGARLGDRTAVLRGDMIVPSTQRTSPYWRYDYGRNRLVLSSYHLSDTTIPEYVKALEAFQPVIIYAYPSSIYAVAEHLLRMGKKPALPSLRGIVTSSETLFPEHKLTIQEAFGRSVFDWYGQAERVTFIGTCPNGSYHLFEDYGYAEFLPVEGSRYQLAGTSFMNDAMPLMRYRTGDAVELDEAGDCACGSAFRKVKRVEGRLDALIRLRDGTLIGRMDLIFKGLQGVRESQIIQSTYEDFTIRIVLDPLTTQNGVLRKLQDNFHLRVGKDIRLNIEPVPAIERTASGKFEAVICRVNSQA